MQPRPRHLPRLAGKPAPHPSLRREVRYRGESQSAGNWYLPHPEIEDRRPRGVRRLTEGLRHHLCRDFLGVLEPVRALALRAQHSLVLPLTLARRPAPRQAPVGPLLSPQGPWRDRVRRAATRAHGQLHRVVVVEAGKARHLVDLLTRPRRRRGPRADRAAPVTPSVRIAVPREVAPRLGPLVPGRVGHCADAHARAHLHGGVVPGEHYPGH